MMYDAIMVAIDVEATGLSDIDDDMLQSLINKDIESMADKPYKLK